MNPSKFFFSFVVLILTISVDAQEPLKPKFEIKPYGFIGYDIYLDTYKSLDSRDGESYLYPLRPQFDNNGRDINSKTMLEMTSLTTRLGTRISGPDFFGAKSSGQVELDFMGSKQDYVLMATLRHAFINLKWEKSELIFGQTWHPVIVNEMIPSIVSFGGGAPFHPLNRSAQVRYSYNLTPILRVTAAALIHGSHRAKGPYDAQRLSGKPDLQVQITYGDHKEFLTGFTAGYNWLTPRLITDSLYKTTKTIGSYNLHAFIMVKPATTSIKFESIYGQNLSFLSMIGGYGMKSGTNSSDGDYSYTNLKTISFWGDVQQDIDNWTIGVFAGYEKLLGADSNYTSIKDYSLTDDISHVMRLAPRVVYKVDAISLAFEYILTTAVYGKAWDAKHKVAETIEPVSNSRFLFRVNYSF